MREGNKTRRVGVGVRTLAAGLLAGFSAAGFFSSVVGLVLAASFTPPDAPDRC